MNSSLDNENRSAGWSLKFPLIVALWVALGLVIFFLIARQNEPTYRGKRLHFWSKVIAASGPNLLQLGKSLEAVNGDLTNLVVFLATFPPRQISPIESALNSLNQKFFDYRLPVPYRPDIALVTLIQLCECSTNVVQILVSEMAEDRLGPHGPANRAISATWHRSMQPLLEALIGTNRPLAKGAAEVLGSHFRRLPPESLPYIFQGIANAETKWRSEFVYLLHRTTLSPNEQTTALKSALHNSNTNFRIGAALSICTDGNEIKSFLPELSGLLTNDISEVRLSVMQALQRIPRASVPLTQGLIANLSSKDTNVAAVAMTTLKLVNPAKAASASTP